MFYSTMSAVGNNDEMSAKVQIMEYKYTYIYVYICMILNDSSVETL